MKEYQIESEIIAYLDGRLNDADSAELMHRVSISPEIRELFEEHQALRRMAVRAAQNVAVPPELEDAVFARVQALHDVEERVAEPIPFWTVKRFSVTAAALALVLAGSFGTMEFGSNSDVAVSNGRSFGSQTSIAHASMAPGMADHVLVDRSISTAVTSAPKFISHSSAIVQRQTPVAIPEANVSSELPSWQPGTPIGLAPMPRSTSIVHPEVGGPSMTSLRDLVYNDEQSGFEVGADFASSFVTPGTARNLAPLNWRARIGYNLDEQNQVGFRISQGPFSTNGLTSDGPFAEVSSTTKSYLSEELYYQHLFPIDRGLFWLTAGVGGGRFDQGWLGGPEVGVKIPLSARMLLGFSFLASYVHHDHTALDEVSSSTPIIFNGTDIQNTLVGRIEYGLSYRF